MSLHDEISRSLEEKGVVFLNDQSIAKILVKYLETIPDTIPNTADLDLALIYVYDMAAQPEKWCKFSGMVFKHVNDKSGAAVYSIGISTAEIARGRDQAILVYMHEAAHILHGRDITAHDETFHAILDGLLSRYNAANGTAIKDDYKQ